MLSLPSAAEPILMSFSIAFTQPTFQRILPLAVGAMLALGRHIRQAVDSDDEVQQEIQDLMRILSKGGAGS